MGKENKISLLKSEKELFDKEIECWPQQIETMIEGIQKNSYIINESKIPNFQTKEEARRYFHSRPFDEFLKEWLK